MEDELMLSVAVAAAAIDSPMFPVSEATLLTSWSKHQLRLLSSRLCADGFLH